MFTTPILAFANIPFYKTSSQPATAASLQDELTIWWASCPDDCRSTGIYSEELTRVNRIQNADLRLHTFKQDGR